MPIHALAVVTSSQDFDLHVDVWQRLRERGSVRVLALPSAGEAVRAQIAAKGFSFFAGAGAWSTDDDVRAAAEAIVLGDPDLVLFGNMHVAPIPALYERLKERGYSGKCVGMQEDLTQPWRVLNRRLAADYWLCFGPRHLSRLQPDVRERTFATGLPALDRTSGMKPAKGGYVLFVPGPSPDHELIDAALGKYEQAIRVPVVVLPGQHPYLHRSALPLPPALQASSGWSREQWLQHANVVLSFSCPLAVSALYLSKPVVILPNVGLPGFEEYVAISDGISPRAINDALRRLVAKPAEVRDFLEEVVGGLRFDHLEGTCRILERLVIDPEFNHAGAPHLEAARKEWMSHHEAIRA